MKLLVTFGCFASVLTLCGQHLEAPQRIIAIPEFFGVRASPMYWERGRFVRVDREKSTVLAFDADGHSIVKARIWPENSLRVMVYNVAVSPSGTYAADATAVSKDGAHASVIALIDAEGRITKMVQTSSAAAFSLRYADDGTLWALVRVHNDQSMELPEYDMLRHYDASGVLIGTALPRTLFNTGGPCPIQQPILTSSGSKPGFYADVAKRWVEVSLDGKLLGNWSFPAPGDGGQMLVDRVALTKTGDLLVSAQTNGGQSNEKHGLYIFERNTQQLRPINTSLLSTIDPAYLIGIDHDDVLITQTSLGPFSWTPWKR